MGEGFGALVVVGPFKIGNIGALPRKTEGDARVPQKIASFLGKRWIVKSIYRAGELISPDIQAQLAHQVHKTHGFRRRLEAQDNVIVFFLLMSTDQEATDHGLDLGDLIYLMETMKVASEPEMRRICKGRHCVR